MSVKQKFLINPIKSYGALRCIYYPVAVMC